MAYISDGTHPVTQNEPRYFVLTDTTSIVSGLNLNLPTTISLKSASANRKIELSFDFVNEYHEILYDFTTSTSIVGALTCPVAKIKVTGDIGDVLTIIPTTTK